MLSRLLLLLPCAVLFSSCNPLELWTGRALHPNARVVAYAPDGRPTFEKEWRNRKRHGVWKMWHENGQLASEVSYLNGKLHGRASSWNSDGSVLSAEDWNEGVRKTTADRGSDAR